MRQLVYLLIIGAAGYLGYNYYRDHFANKSEDGAAPSAEVASSAPAKKPEPAFQSQIPASVPGEKHLAPPGIFYMLDRVSVETAAGISAVVPGEKVKLLQRKGDGALKVTTGKIELDVKESQTTNDLDLAREVEKKYVAVHPASR